MLAMLACNAASGGGDPTAAPTNVPPAEEPTAIAEPTEVSEPTESIEPTQVSEDPPPADEDAPPLEILQVNGFLDSFDNWVIVGLIRNNSNRAVDNIEIEVELFDESDNSPLPGHNLRRSLQPGSG